MNQRSNDNAKDGDDDVRRGRPGRRSAKERMEAVLALIGGKKSVDTLAKQFGVSAAWNVRTLRSRRRSRTRASSWR